MASTSEGESNQKLQEKLCTKNRNCSKENKHSGRCDKARQFHAFWNTSRVQVRNTLKRKSEEFAEETKSNFEEQSARFVELESREEEIIQKEIEADKLLNDTRAEVAEQEHKLELLKSQYDCFKALLGQTQQARAKRMKNPTTFDSICDVKNSTRYRRRKETKDILMYIHGNEEGAIFGAWDIIAAHATDQIISKLIASYKRGKYLQGVFGKSVNDFSNSEDAIKQAVALKYQNYLSQRKFKLVCKTQSSVYDADKEVWVPRNVKCLDVEVTLPKITSNEKVDRFIKGLDIGNISPITTNYPGVSRTVTGLVYMILDLHLRLPRFSKQLIWFNGNINHFIFQFSDDGAPETSELGMSIGSLTCWNFGNRVRSREFHYLLHCLSVSEKDPVMEDIWRQHTDEMQVMEGNLLTVCGHQCTVEFQPSADQSWQSWANNELNQAATYPSPYANVHHGEFSRMGGSIGSSDKCTWKPFTKESRERDLVMLGNFRKTLPKMSEAQSHKKELEFMAANGLRQIGEPRIGYYANLQRPEPLHNEINAWQHLLNVMYKEALQRKCVDSFLHILGSPVKVAENTIQTQSGGVTAGNSRETADVNESNLVQPGCGLVFIANKVREHYNDKSHQSNNLSARLIGKQAIALAKHSFKLVDALEVVDESEAQKLKRLALGKIAQYLRNTGTLFNKVITNKQEIGQLQDYLTQYFNLLALFFPASINVTVWTMAYAIPYHSSVLFENYAIGLGIISLQAKESKHAGVKHDLSLTNRSKSTGSLGKWWQVMRANYLRAFYLPEHHPMPSTYISHYESRMPSQVAKPDYCDCGRKKSDPHEQLCSFCMQCTNVLRCALEQKLIPDVEAVVLPVVCSTCHMRFPDKLYHDDHVKNAHSTKNPVLCDINVKSLTVPELKQELRRRGLSVTGTKEILRKRLEGRMAGEIS